MQEPRRRLIRVCDCQRRVDGDQPLWQPLNEGVQLILGQRTPLLFLRHTSLPTGTDFDHSLVSRSVDLPARMSDGDEGEALRALEIDTVEEASAALARLLSVTEATMGRRAQLEGALQSRIAIEQAKGVVAERHGLDVEEAFALLRRAARSKRVRLQDLARRVRPGEPDPPDLAEELEALRRRGDV